MKHENSIRLAKEAAANVINGGASALTKVRRLQNMGGGYEADVIVSRIYSRSDGKATHDCIECGSEYVDPAEAAACCEENLNY